MDNDWMPVNTFSKIIDMLENMCHDSVMDIKPAPPKYVYQREVKEKAEKRKELILKMRQAEWTWQAIGDELWITKQRAWQLVKDRL